jgi:sugar transferase (PEP-CTERM/EpsH1 system associated)
MAKLLYLVHRMPYPPNKGDKVRSYHLLKHLVAQGHEVYLGTFVDDEEDWVHLPALKSLCADVCARPLAARSARLRSLTGLLLGKALTLQYYADGGLRDWVKQTVAHARLDAVLVFSSAMAQYAEPFPQLPLLADLVDVDSAKWRDYAAAHRFPMSWVYRREADRLLAYERAVVARAQRSFLVTDNEVALFNQLAPECAGQVQALGNGVDAEFFSPERAYASPFLPDETALVFTGAMDYWPNIDAVTWFVRDMLPTLRQRWPALRFHIVGRSPAPAVAALAGAAVVVSGTVPDVRPYLQHAAAIVAPLRLARGVQNKVLEAMAMGRPVVAAGHCLSVIDVAPDQPTPPALAANDIADYLARLDTLLSDPGQANAIGQAARRFVLARFGWAARLAPLDQLLPTSARHALPAAASA